MKRFFAVFIGLVMAVVLRAENYPYKSDYLWVTVPDHADWLYKTGEQARVEVQFYKYGIPRDGVVEYVIGNDLMEADMKGTVTLKNGRAVIKAGTAKNPCFRDIRLTMKLDGKTYQHHVKMSSPEKIVPYTQEPKDFWQFWQDNIKEAKKYPLKFTKTPCPEFTTDKTDCYLVRIELNRQHQALYGLLMMPKNSQLSALNSQFKKYPVVLCPPGAGVKTIKDPNSRDYYPENGVIRFITEIHGMNPLMPEEYFNDVRSAFDGREKGYLYQGIDSRDHYYMKHVYLGLVRCIDFLTSLPEWDGKNVIAQGGSQGGALSLIAAALDPRVTLCVANHPALSDMSAAAEEGRTHGYPHFSKKEGFLTPQHLQTLPYFDVCCFAPYIKAKTYMTWGYNDNTCPPTTSYAVWNLLKCEKESLVTPINEHWTSDATNRQQLDWILKNISVQPKAPMVHDPVMAKEGDTYYLYSTGMGIQRLTSKDRKSWTIERQPVMSVIPGWTTNSVPGFRNHVWAPDVIKWHGRWWLSYSCSTFGKNGSAIGLLSSRSLASNSWKDEGCIVTSREKRDNWNAIDPNFIIDDATDTPWMVWGSFWDGIQIARLDSTMHIAKGQKPRTIARRYDPNYKPTEPNPTSKYAGTNAIEAPFIFKHGGYYYLFVSWDYCCRGAKSNYRVAVGRSKTVDGPYLDRDGKDMAQGGGTLFIEGDKKQWEAAGHCAAYSFDGEDIFICHGYSTAHNGAALLIQRPITWTADGWPMLK